MGDSVTREEIERYGREYDEPHPVFDVEHRPERVPLTPSGCLWEGCNEEEGVRIVQVDAVNGEACRSRLCCEHREQTAAQDGVSVEVLADE